MTPELSVKIALWRQKIKDKTITRAEMKEALAALREGRIAAAETSAKSKSTKAAKKPVDADSLLGELEGL